MNNFFLNKPRAEARRIKESVTESGLRIYPCDPETAMIQLRVQSRSGGYGNGTIAHAAFNLDELTRIRAAIDEQIARLTKEAAQ